MRVCVRVRAGGLAERVVLRGPRTSSEALACDRHRARQWFPTDRVGVPGRLCPRLLAGLIPWPRGRVGPENLHV